MNTLIFVDTAAAGIWYGIVLQGVGMVYGMVWCIKDAERQTDKQADKSVFTKIDSVLQTQNLFFRICRFAPFREI